MTNTEEIKRLAEIIKSANITEKNSYSLSVAKAIFNAGYLPSSSVVSPLVWETYLSDAERAFTPIGQYVVRNWGFPLNDRKVWGCYFNGTTICEKSTEEEAKKACQNHYQSLIGSCLQGGGYTEEQMLRLIQGLKDYTRESHAILGFDEREPEEFLEIFKKDEAALKQQ